MRRINRNQDVRALLFETEQDEMDGYVFGLFAVGALWCGWCLDERNCEDGFVAGGVLLVGVGKCDGGGKGCQGVNGGACDNAHLRKPHSYSNKRQS